jgi:hypothetical protein
MIKILYKKLLLKWYAEGTADIELMNRIYINNVQNILYTSLVAFPHWKKDGSLQLSAPFGMIF